MLSLIIFMARLMCIFPLVCGIVLQLSGRVFIVNGTVVIRMLIRLWLRLDLVKGPLLLTYIGRFLPFLLYGGCLMRVLICPGLPWTRLNLSWMILYCLFFRIRLPRVYLMLRLVVLRCRLWCGIKALCMGTVSGYTFLRRLVGGAVVWTGRSILLGLN